MRWFVYTRIETVESGWEICLFGQQRWGYNLVRLMMALSRNVMGGGELGQGEKLAHDQRTGHFLGK
jgi:hypothetical protein